MVSAGDFRVYMRQLAGSVWNEQRAAHSYGLSLQEETITELLLLNMARTLSPLGLKVRMFSKQEEGGKTRKIETRGPSGETLTAIETIIEAEGADWEWFVEDTFGCSAVFRVQAKKLYHSPQKAGYYGGFDPVGKQIDDLIARARGANPIYVLYNHGDVRDASLFGPTRQPEFFGRSSWGCAVTTAQFMKHVPDNKLATIKRGCLPWHRFFSIGRPCRPAIAMAQIGEQVGGEGEAELQAFIPAAGRPEWVGMIGEGSDITGYLKDRHLHGVAFIGVSDLRG